MTTEGDLTMIDIDKGALRLCYRCSEQLEKDRP